MEEIEKIKENISKLEKGLGNPLIPANLKTGMTAQLEKLKSKLETLEAEAAKKVVKAEEKVEKAEEKVEQAKKAGNKGAAATATKELTKAKGKKKAVKKAVVEITKTAEKAEKVSKKANKAVKKAKEKEKQEEKKAAKKAKAVHKIDVKTDAAAKESRKKKVAELKPKGKHGGVRKGAGRKVGSTSTKLVVPKGVTPLKRKEKMQTVRAFGQKIEYKNSRDFCSKLKAAYLKRRKISKKGGTVRKTKPVFGVITSSVKNAVSKALHNVSERRINSNPQKFLADAQKLEKSAIKFLEDFKTILGGDYKSSEIKSEFGELEKSIKAFVSKFTKE